MEFKKLQFEVENTKQSVNSENQPIGIIKGLAAAFSLDEVNDRILPGAFEKTILEHKSRNNRPIRFKFQHKRDDIIGIFPIMKVFETERGLSVEGELNLEVQKGFESFSLAKQGAMTDLSIGFMIPEGGSEFNSDGIRIIKEIDLVEISIVDEPANRDATINEVKNVVPFQDLPLSDIILSDITCVWNAEGAIERVKNLDGMIDSDGKPTKLFKNAFMFFDSSQPENFESYKSSALFADVINGKLMAIPGALLAVRDALDEGLDISVNDMPRVKQNINKYFRKINKEFDRNLDIPFKSFTIENESDIKTVRDVENLLTSNGFSRSKAKQIISIIKHSQRDADNDSLNDDSKQKDTLRDASVKKLHHLLMMQKLNTIIQ